jgi:hypothetical protein
MLNLSLLSEMTGRRSKKTGKDKKDPELEELEFLKKDIQAELKEKESIKFDNDELEKRLVKCIY